MTDSTPMDDLLDLHGESKKKILAIFGVDPDWFSMSLSDERGKWWCVLVDELVIQYGDHAFSDETIRRAWYRTHQIYTDEDPFVRTADDHVLVLIERDFGNVFFVLDRSLRLTDAEAKPLEEIL